MNRLCMYFRTINFSWNSFALTSLHLRNIEHPLRRWRRQRFDSLLPLHANNSSNSINNIHGDALCCGHHSINLAIPEHAKITYMLVDYLRRINHADLNILRCIITLQLDAHFMYHALQFSGFSIDQNPVTAISFAHLSLCCKSRNLLSWKLELFQWHIKVRIDI